MKVECGSCINHFRGLAAHIIDKLNFLGFARLNLDPDHAGSQARLHRGRCVDEKHQHEARVRQHRHRNLSDIAFLLVTRRAQEVGVSGCGKLPPLRQADRLHAACCCYRKQAKHRWPGVEWELCQTGRVAEKCRIAHCQKWVKWAPNGEERGKTIPKQIFSPVLGHSLIFCFESLRDGPPQPQFSNMVFHLMSRQSSNS